MRVDLEKLLKGLGSMEEIYVEARKMEEAEGFILFKEDNEVTNEKILSFDLVGVISSDHNGLPSVNVIKNRMNGVVGEVSFDIWFSLIEDKVALNRRNYKAQDNSDFKEKISESPEIKFDEVFIDLSKSFKERFGGVETSLGESFDKIRPKAEKLGDDIASGVLNIFSAVEEAIQDIQPRVQEVKETVQDKATTGLGKGLETAQILKLKIRITKLQAIKAEAISEEVATKKFIKKIDEKIDRIQSILGN